MWPFVGVGISLVRLSETHTLETAPVLKWSQRVTQTLYARIPFPALFVVDSSLQPTCRAAVSLGLVAMVHARSLLLPVWPRLARGKVPFDV